MGHELITRWDPWFARVFAALPQFIVFDRADDLLRELPIHRMQRRDELSNPRSVKSATLIVARSFNRISLSGPSKSGNRSGRRGPPHEA
jgi:hypothetical protein